MSIDTRKSLSQESADFQAMIDHAFKRLPVDPEVARRVNERAERVREELRKRGTTNIAVDLIREAREEI